MTEGLYGGQGFYVISLGGNALIRRGERGTIEEQFEHARSCMEQVSLLVRAGNRVVITHGNGPIVGNIVLRNEAAKNTVPPMPLYICDADSEGGIGYMLQQTIYNSLREIGHPGDVVTVITQVVVDKNDPAFLKPTKPIGAFYSEGEADDLGKEKLWRFIEDSGRGFRRVVPSPVPRKIVESGVIRSLCELGVIVIAAGGGGVPVIELDDKRLRGVDAVIDKDLSTSLLAREIGAERIINLTEVDRVYLNYGRENQEGLVDVSLSKVKEYSGQGHFAAGSMGPKIEAAVEFIEGGGQDAVIARPGDLLAAMEGGAGTRIIL